MSVEIKVSGPLLEGAGAGPIFDRWVDELIDRYTSKGLAEVSQIMDASFRNPTPYYETQVSVDKATDSATITDHGVIYGPWLEGVGSRNATSRFKGYSMWRRTFQLLNDDRAIASLAETELATRLGG